MRSPSIPSAVITVPLRLRLPVTGRWPATFGQRLPGPFPRRASTGLAAPLRTGGPALWGAWDGVLIPINVGIQLSADGMTPSRRMSTAGAAVGPVLARPIWSDTTPGRACSAPTLHGRCRTPRAGALLRDDFQRVPDGLGLIVFVINDDVIEPIGISHLLDGGAQASL